MRLREPIYNIRGLVRDAVVAEGRYDAEILEDAYRFSVSAWRYAAA